MQADVITGNIISGQVIGDTAKKLIENFGKIVQDNESRKISGSDVSISKTDYAISASKIAALSSGEFVGVVAENPQEKISLKCSIQKSRMTMMPLRKKKRGMCQFQRSIMGKEMGQWNIRLS